MTKFIPDVAFRSPVRIFGASGCQELPVFSSFSVNRKSSLVEKVKDADKEKDIIDVLKTRKAAYDKFSGAMQDIIRYTRLRDKTRTVLPALHYNSLISLAACRLTLAQQAYPQDRLMQNAIKYLKEAYDL